MNRFPSLTDALMESSDDFRDNKAIQELASLETLFSWNPWKCLKIEFFKRYNYNKKLLRHHSSLCIFSSIPLDMARYQNPMMSVVTWWKIISYGKLQIFPWNPQQWRHHDRHETSRGWANEYLQGNVGKRVAMLMEIFIGSIQHCVSEGTVNYRTWFGEGCK